MISKPNTRKRPLLTIDFQKNEKSQAKAV